MGSTRDFVAATVADTLLPAIRRPVEDVIYETLDRRQVPNRTDFKEMRDLVDSLRGQLTGATGGVKKLADRTADLQDQLGAVVDRLDEITSRLDALTARLDSMEGARQAAPIAEEVDAAALESRLERFAAELEQRRLTADDDQPAAEPDDFDDEVEDVAPEEGEEPAGDDEICLVEGCGETTRARGFCARHYQRWRRGTLEGYPNE